MLVAKTRIEADAAPPMVAFVGAEEATPYGQIARRFASAGVACRQVSTLGGAGDAAVSIFCCDRVQGESLQNLIDAGKRGPIVVLCEELEQVDRIVALELGADDVFALDHDLREMVARVRALARRKRLTEARSSVSGHRDWSLKPLTRMLTTPDGRLIPLTFAEIRAFLVLSEAGGEVVSRDVIVSKLYGDRHIATRSADTLLCRLRKKLDRYHPPLIRTLRGGGYYLDAPVEIM